MRFRTENEETARIETSRMDSRKIKAELLGKYPR